MPTPKKSTALARTSRATIVEEAPIVVTGVPSLDLVKECIANGTKLSYEGEDATASVLLSTLNAAKSASDLFAASTLEKMEDHLDETLTILAIDGVNNSDYEGGLGIWLVVSAATLDGEVMKLVVGATQPLAFIVALAEWGELPYPVAFERSVKETKAGYRPINCVSRRTDAGITF